MKLDYTLLDEVSMLQEMLYKFFRSVSRALPNSRPILAVDLNQREPVNTELWIAIQKINCIASVRKR